MDAAVESCGGRRRAGGAAARACERRDGASAAEIACRMAAQLSDDVLSARAGYTIVNINREDLAADVAECDRRFRYEAAGN